MQAILPNLAVLLATTSKNRKIRELLVFIFLLNFSNRKKVKFPKPNLAPTVETYQAPVFKNNIHKNIIFLKKRILAYIKLGYSYKYIRRFFKLWYALLLFCLFEYTFHMFVKTKDVKVDFLLCFATLAVYLIILWLLKYF